MIHDTDPLDVIIVGGGLSGLILARNISKQNKTWKLLEATKVFGGRIQNDSSGNEIDLGGAWIWSNQKVMLELIQSLQLKLFPQPGNDDHSSLRVVGGAETIVTALVDGLDDSCIETNCQATTFQRISKDLVSVQSSSGKLFHAKTICLTCPPKIIDLHMTFHPVFSKSKKEAMSCSQTWMAGVTKVALLYHCEKFWSDQLSNGGLCPENHRPAFQYYDASPLDGAVCALTFFTLASFSTHNNDENLARDCANQLCESVSECTKVDFKTIEKIRQFDDYHVKRWPLHKFISETPNPTSISPHPEPNPHLAQSEWDGRLFFAGTESDLQSPGLMEGAVNAANRATNEIISSLESMV